MFRFSSRYLLFLFLYISMIRWLRVTENKHHVYPKFPFFG